MHFLFVYSFLTDCNNYKHLIFCLQPRKWRNSGIGKIKIIINIMNDNYKIIAFYFAFVADKFYILKLQTAI